MTDHNHRQRLLRGALRANAVFSGLCGLTATLMGSRLTTYMGFSSASEVYTQGVILILFSGWLFFISSRPVIPFKQAGAAALLDVLYVVGNVPVLLGSPDLTFTPAGRGILSTCTIVVAIFAVLQMTGLWKVRSGSLTHGGDPASA